MTTTGFLAALAILWPVVLASFVLKVFPDLLGKLLLKGIEHASEARLARIKDELGRDTSVHVERIKADLLATYSTLQTSVNVIAAGQTGMREGIISSVQKLWVTVLQLRSDFGGLVVLTMLLTPQEIAQLVQGGGTAGSKEYVEKYHNDQWVSGRSILASSSEVEMARLFCGDKLWLLFYVIRVAYARPAWQMVNSLKQKRYTDWRADSFYLSTLRLAVPDDVIQQACGREELGLQSILNRWRSISYTRLPSDVWLESPVGFSRRHAGGHAPRKTKAGGISAATVAVFHAAIVAAVCAKEKRNPISGLCLLQKGTSNNAMAAEASSGRRCCVEDDVIRWSVERVLMTPFALPLRRGVRALGRLRLRQVPYTGCAAVRSRWTKRLML